MNNLQSIALKGALVLVIIFFGGWMLGGIINLVALFNPQVVTLVNCPEGSTAHTDWVQQSFDQPGQKTLTITCLAPDGTHVTPLSDAATSAIQYRYFYPAGVIGMALLVVAWFIRSAVKRGRVASTAS